MEVVFYRLGRGRVRGLKFFEEVTYRDLRTGDKVRGNAVSFHWNRYHGTTFQVVDECDKMVKVHQSDILSMEGGEW